MADMISFGAGVNSVAMTIVSIEDGWRGPIVFADTGGEHPETYCYLDYFERSYLRPRGLEVIRLMPGSPWHSSKARLPLETYALSAGIIPLLSVRWCTAEWKHDPLDRWRKDYRIERPMIGFAIDEPLRRRDPAAIYPLDDRGINRAECARIIQRAGLDIPRKSGCFFCPGQSLGQWRALYLDYPDLFWRAVALEDNANRHNQKNATLDPHGIKLTDHLARRWEGQRQMDLSEWLPCLCRI